MKGYINYIRRQNKYIQDIHAVAFATIGTIIISLFWLQYHYNMFTPTYTRLELPSKIEPYSISSPIATDTVSKIDKTYTQYDPLSTLYKIIQEAKVMVKGN